MDTVNSLTATLEALNARLIAGQCPTESELRSTVTWLMGRQARAGRYAGLFPPTDAEIAAGVRLFTGEGLHTRLGPRNVLSHEAGRILRCFGNGTLEVQTALDRLDRALREECYVADGCTIGECAHSGVSFMRYLTAGGWPDTEARLEQHLAGLTGRRTGDGRWRGFPFYYTLLVLTEIELPAARAELRYAAPTCERLLRRASPETPFSARRRLVLERVLARSAHP